jgi:hypothetical protein
MGYTKGNFKDGYNGWKIDTRTTNGVRGFEIHYSDAGECVTDHVYTIDDAALIAAAPIMLKFIQEMAKRYENSEWIAGEANEIIAIATNSKN